MVAQFTLRLFFFGLLALVDGKDGKSLTVLLYNDPPAAQHHGQKCAERDVPGDRPVCPFGTMSQ